MTRQETVYLVDARPYIFRAHFSLPASTLATDAPVHAGLDELAYAGADPDAVGALFERLGFKGIRERITAWR
jgi:hypothetical protein